MKVFLGLLILAFLIGVPFYFIGLFFFYRKRPRPGIVFWLVNPAVALVWIAFVLLLVFSQQIARHNADQTASTQASSAASSPNFNLNLTGYWSSTSDGNSWLQASEADKQALAAAFAAASSTTNHHTAAFFYTNLNENWDSSNGDLQVQPLIMFLKLDNIGPDKSNPPFQGFSWRGHDVKHTPQGDVERINVFWQDGHSFIHDQKIQNDGTYTEAGMDGPWDGDVDTYTATTTVSGNTFTIQTSSPLVTTQTGTFQVSADGQELDMTEGGRPPGRYILVAHLVNSLNDIK
jgi:hypothetical protein